MTLSRRVFLMGTLALPGCTAIASLNNAATPLDTYALQPASGTAQRSRSSRSLLVLEPTAPAAIATDRLLIKPQPLSVTYLPGARWADTVPQMMQSVLIRSLADSGGLGFVGVQGAGPVPDTVLLTRIDAFEVNVLANGTYEVSVSLDLTVLRDRDQRVLGTRRVAQSRPIGSDRADIISQGFQHLLDDVLPQTVAWVVAVAS